MGFPGWLFTDWPADSSQTPFVWTCCETDRTWTSVTYNLHTSLAPAHSNELNDERGHGLNVLYAIGSVTANE